MAPARILLLTPPEDADALASLLHAHRPDLEVVALPDKATLLAAEIRPGDRLVAVCSEVIVPAATLDALDQPAYNLHPGPPAFPGLFPAVHAIEQNAETFGATAHELTPEIDAGAIVGVIEIPMPEAIDRFHLEALSRELVLRLFEAMAQDLATADQPLEPVDRTWGPYTYTAADFEALCRLPADVDAETFARRLRAVGEGPLHALRIQLHGRTFSLDPLPGDGTVYKGGKPVGD